MSVITRGDWGAGPHRAGTIATPVQRLFLHHSVTPQWTGEEAARKLQQIARSRNFVDISYSWLVDVAGNEIEGRGWGRQGAHTVGWNSTAHAIVLVGNFDTTRPPQAMLAGVASLARKHGARGLGPAKITHGHRDVASTACPGAAAYGLIGEINRLAAGSAPAPDDLDATMFCKLGDKGLAVSYLQLQLRELGHDIADDGDYGPATATAVLAMRREAGSTAATSGDRFNDHAKMQIERLLARKRGAVPPAPAPVPVSGTFDIVGSVSGTITPKV